MFRDSVQPSFRINFLISLIFMRFFREVRKLRFERNDRIPRVHAHTLHNDHCRQRFGIDAMRFIYIQWGNNRTTVTECTSRALT